MIILVVECKSPCKPLGCAIATSQLISCEEDADIWSLATFLMKCKKVQHISSEARCENQKTDVAPFCTLHFVKKVARACVEHIQRTSTALRVEKMDIESWSTRTPKSLTRPKLDFSFKIWQHDLSAKCKGKSNYQCHSTLLRWSISLQT